MALTPARSRSAIPGALNSRSTRARSSTSPGAQVSPSTPSRTGSASAPAVVVIDRHAVARTRAARSARRSPPGTAAPARPPPRTAPGSRRRARNRAAAVTRSADPEVGHQLLRLAGAAPELPRHGQREVRRRRGPGRAAARRGPYTAGRCRRTAGRAGAGVGGRAGSGRFGRGLPGQAALGAGACPARIGFVDGPGGAVASRRSRTTAAGARSRAWAAWAA